MLIYLPIAEMAVSAELIFMVSVFVGVLAGLFGIGGGFLTTPFLIFSGVPPAIAVGTQTCQVVANGTSGVLGHLRKGHVDIKMAAVMTVGGIAGSVAGILIFKALEYTGQIDFAIFLLYAVLLVTIGGLMLFESVFSLVMKGNNIRREFNTFRTSSFIAALPYKMRFPQSKLYISALVPGAVGFVGGVLASVLGMGGGFFLVPAMIYIIGMPGLMVAGTSLLQIIFTTSFAALLHSVANQTVDVMLAAILISGGVIGAQVGVALSRVVKGIYARLILAVLVLVVGIQLSGQLFVQPHELFSTVIR
jgi:uncharacterized membrane protein YfcA